MKDLQRLAEQGDAKAPANMVLIPKGPFLYGLENERLRLTIDYDYFMDIYLVTNQHYDPFIRAGGYDNKALWSKEGWSWKRKEKVSQPKWWDDPKWNSSDHPVVGVSYFEAEAFANWAGKRLPTEQEWEKAARGTDGRKYPWGDEFDKNKCNCYEAGIGGNTPVTQYADGKSPFGCHDMAGNVSNWCASWYDYHKSARVLRGGTRTSTYKEDLRSAYRIGLVPRNRYNYVGFRCAQDAQ